MPGDYPLPMRLTTWNVNGLRAALRKGITDKLAEIDPDVLLLQEVRATPEQLGDFAQPKINGQAWHAEWHPAQKLGYAGVAILSKHPINRLGTGLSKTDADPEGRVLSVEIQGITLHSIYLPSGSSGDHRQQAKEAWMRRFRPWATKQNTDQPTLLAGDFNIALTPNDLYYAKSNEKQSGYLPHERTWMKRLIESGWHDTTREQFGDTPGPYTWWSNRGQARALDRGWRIDYWLANPAAHARLQDTLVHREQSLGVSDHAPISIDVK